MSIAASYSTRSLAVGTDITATLSASVDCNYSSHCISNTQSNDDDWPVIILTAKLSLIQLHIITQTMTPIPTPKPSD